MHRGDSSQKRKKQFGSLLMLADVTPLQLTRSHFLAKEKEIKQPLKNKYYKYKNLNRQTAAIAARIGATTGTQAYHHLESPLCSPRTDFGSKAWTIRGPRSRAGLRPGPVGPPSEATKVITRKPRPKCATASDPVV